MAYSHAIEGM
jgi:hypothetical protein